MKDTIITIHNGPGQLVCRMVLPEVPKITTIGGPGKECWVDGRNWPPIEKPWTRDAGAWRVEVSPSVPAKRDLFLHVLQTDGSEIAANDSVLLIRQAGRIGVQMKAQGRVCEVLFATGAAAAHLRITERGRVVVERDLK